MLQVARPSTPPSKHTESSRLPAICDTRLLECVPDNKMRGMLNARRFLVLLVANLSIWAPYPGLAELPKGNSEKIELPIEEWLAQGQTRTFRWKLRVSRPELTFQQRYRVWVTASIDTESLQARNIQRDLHFILKVADQRGKWFAGDTYNTFQINKALDVPEDIQFEAGLYLRPGAYKVGVVVYDSILNEHDVVFAHVSTRASANQAFSADLRTIPAVEFLPAPVEGLVPLGTGRAPLAIATKQPLQIDVIVDLASNAPIPRPKLIGSDIGSFPGQRTNKPPFPQSLGKWRPPRLPLGTRDTEKGYQTQLLEAASILGDLQPTSGCNNMMVINSLDRRVMMNRKPAASVDWLKLWEEVMAAQLNLISVHDLSGATKATGFLRDKLQAAMDQKADCNVNGVQPNRIIAILSFGAHFPRTGPVPTVQPDSHCKIFYLQEHQELPPDVVDDLRAMIAPAHPIHLTFSNPRQFREKVEELVRSVSASQ